MERKKNMNVVEFSKFLDQLEEKHKSQLEEGNHEKAKTTDISLQVARKVGEVVPFLDRKKAKQIVMNTFPEMEEDRADEAGELLHIVVKDVTDVSSSTIYTDNNPSPKE